MDTTTQLNDRGTPTLSFHVHRRARRERARAIGRAFARLVEKLNKPQPSSTWAVRWG